MRLIGHINNEANARKFGDYLAAQEIRNQVEPESDGSWAVWVYSEDHIDSSHELFKKFQDLPDDPKYSAAAAKAAALRERERREQRTFEKKIHTRDNIWQRGSVALTTALIAISVLVSFYSKLNASAPQLDILRISESFTQLLPEVRSGQIWRLITPIFIHDGPLHLLFNMLWLLDLGSRVEARQGTLKLLLIVLLLAILPNLGQYLISGPRFGGMSGVVYGLLGYVWIRGKSDPASGLYLESSTAIMMLIWFVICLLGIVPNVANTVHAVGLAVGLALGALPWVTAKFSR